MTCSVPGLKRHCSILTVSYLQSVLPRCTPRLCSFSILRWKLGLPLRCLHFLSSLLSFPHSTWEVICVGSWKGSIGWLDLWCGCSKPGFELGDQETWETTVPAAWLLWLSVWLSSQPLREGEIILINAWKICCISHVIFRGCWSVEKAVLTMGLSLWNCKETPFSEAFLRPTCVLMGTFDCHITSIETFHKVKQPSASCTLRKTGRLEFTSWKRTDDKTTLYWKDRMLHNWEISMLKNTYIYTTLYHSMPCIKINRIENKKFGLLSDFSKNTSITRLKEREVCLHAITYACHVSGSCWLPGEANVAAAASCSASSQTVRSRLAQSYIPALYKHPAKRQLTVFLFM